MALINAELDAFPPDSSGLPPTTGPLSSTGGAIFVDSTLNVNGDLTLDPASETGLSIYGSGSTPGVDFSQLNATGTVTLGGALKLFAPATGSGQPCQLAPGHVYPLIMTTGTVVATSTFSNAGDGAVVPLGCGSCSAQINATKNSVTATIVGTTVSMGASASSASTNQPVTLTATLNTYPGAPSGGVEFDANGAAIPGCTNQAVTGTTATCQASFSAGSRRRRSKRPARCSTAASRPAGPPSPGGSCSAAGRRARGARRSRRSARDRAPGTSAGH